MLTVLVNHFSMQTFANLCSILGVWASKIFFSKMYTFIQTQHYNNTTTTRHLSLMSQKQQLLSPGITTQQLLNPVITLALPEADGNVTSFQVFSHSHHSFEENEILAKEKVRGSLKSIELFGSHECQTCANISSRC